MRRLVSYVLVFVIGFAVCALILNQFWGLSGSGARGLSSGTEAPRGAPVLISGGRNLVADSAARIGKAVVNIDTVGRPAGGLFPGLDLPDMLTPHNWFRSEPPKGQASGVIVSSDGYVLTNNHVVAEAQTVTVTLNLDGKHDRQSAKVIGTDPTTDLAVLKIPPRRGGYPYAKFGDSGTLRVGDWVIAIGNSLGLGTTVTVGVVSALARDVPVEGERLENAIQTDAAINRGNSGGALSDLNGQLVGISTAIASTSPGGGSIGIGFAIPSNSAKRIANELIAKGKIVRPWIGIKYRPLTGDARKNLEQQGAQNIPRGDGMLIIEVLTNSPADKAGLQPLDVIVKVQGKPVKDIAVIKKALEGKKPGDVIYLEVWHARTGQTSRLAIRLGEMPAGADSPAYSRASAGLGSKKSSQDSSEH